MLKRWTRRRLGGRKRQFLLPDATATGGADTSAAAIARRGR